MTFTNIGAGVETSGATISNLINSITRHPGTQERIHEDLETARKEGRLSNPPKLGEMKQLPFLTACFKESSRLFPAVGMPLVRKVPVGGLELEGYFLPAGVRISC